MDEFELLARRGVALGWLLSAIMAVGGAWQGRRAAGRSIGRPFRKLPRWYFVALLPYVGVMARLWRPIPVRLPPPGRLATDILGGALALAGMLLIGWGRQALGRMYNISSTRGVQLYENQELITAGPFRLVRHPMYFGAVLAGMGSVAPGRRHPGAHDGFLGARVSRGGGTGGRIWIQLAAVRCARAIGPSGIGYSPDSHRSSHSECTGWAGFRGPHPFRRLGAVGNRLAWW
jgi:protein-S-isoprenylcysteine O-methyltransferase Ste14